MSPRVLWMMTLPLAFLGWVAVALFTAAAPPSLVAYFVVLPLVALALTMTTAGPIWLLARAWHLPGTGQRPVLALRAAAWLGVWAVLVLALRLAGFPVLIPAAGLAVALALFEVFLLRASTSSGQTKAAAKTQTKAKTGK